MLPVGLGVLVVAGLCVPSYLWLEPTAAPEEVGVLCWAFSIMTAALGVLSITRGLRAIRRSISYLRACERTGRRMDLAGETSPAWIVDEPVGLFAMGGIIHPRLLMSGNVFQVLSPEQLDAALRHERAHWLSRDNLKRLCLLAAPDILPFLDCFQALEQSWAKYTERAADDRAVAGDAGRSLALAAALVRVGRLRTSAAPSLAAPLLAGDGDLGARVERLLNAESRPESRSGWLGCLVASATVLLSGVMVTIGLQPALLVSVHRFLEHLIR
jgi:Zn-dependent protease with chaperone function